MPMGKIYKVKKAKKPEKQIATKQYVKRVIARNIENKLRVDSMAVAFGSVGNSWTELSPLPAQGETLYTRIGNRIKIKSFEFTGVLVGGQVNGVADDAYNVLRCYIAIWDGTSATPLATNGASMNAYIATSNPEGKGLLRTLYDKTITLPCNGLDSTGYVPKPRIFKYRKYFKNGLNVEFRDTTDDLPDKRFVVSMITDSTAVPNPGFVTGYYKMEFEDA